jgi:hypothetical protein
VTSDEGRFNFSVHGAFYTSDFYVALCLPPAMYSTLITPLVTSALLLSGCPTGPSFLGGFLMSIEFTLIV